jgi:cell division septation protein DedD
MNKKIFYVPSLILIIAAATIMSFTFTQTSQAATVSGSKTKTTMTVKRTAKTKPTSAQIAALKVKQQAIVAALDANNYNSWVTSVGTSSPLLTKINATNFSQYDQAYQLRKQADAIMKGLGLQNGRNNGMIGAWGK